MATDTLAPIPSCFAKRNSIRRSRPATTLPHWFALVAAAGLTAPAMAAADAADAVGAEDPVEEVVVTAQRRSQSIEDVPMTVTILSADDLASSGAASVRDLANVTSGYQLNNAGFQPQPAIRGITTINSGFYENNVAVFVDGLYQVTPTIINMDLPNIENIQILKGPQGTLYGRNATGGAILVDTLDPSDDLRADVSLTYARFDDKRASGYVSGPLGDKVGFIVSGYVRDTGGYFRKASRTEPGEFDGHALGLRQESIRTKLTFEPTDRLDATLGYAYTKVGDPRGINFTPIENVPATYNGSLAGGETRATGLGETAYNLDPHNIGKQHEASLKLEYDTAIGGLESITGYTQNDLRTEYDFDGSYIPLYYSFLGTRDKTWQQAFNFNVDTVDRLALIVGATYFRIDTHLGDPPNTFLLGPAVFGQSYPDPGTAEVPVSEYATLNQRFFDRRKDAWALYDDATFEFTERLSVNLGGRYSKEKQDVASLQYGFGGEAGDVVAYDTRAYEAENGVKFESTYSKFTPRVALTYEFAESSNVYASYSQGFRAGEWNDAVPQNDPSQWFDLGEVGQETVDAWEIGFKTARSRMSFELSSFYYDYKNLQVAFTQNIDGAAVVVLQQFPKSEIYGAESNFSFRLAPGLNLRGGATWLHARYGDGAYFSGSGVNPAVNGINESDDPLKTLTNISVWQDLSGQQMSRAPNFAAFLGMDYLIPIGAQTLQMAVNAKYTDSYVVTNPSIYGGDPNYDPDTPGSTIDNFALLRGTPYENDSEKQRARQGSFVTLNASVTWTGPAERYFVRLWGTNLLDEKYRLHYNPLSIGTYSPMGEPRSYGVTLGLRFRGV